MRSYFLVVVPICGGVCCVVVFLGICELTRQLILAKRQGQSTNITKIHFGGPINEIYWCYVKDYG